MPHYKGLLEQAIAHASRWQTIETPRFVPASDMLAIGFGKEILKIIPGRVSTEVDARLSFDTEATINKAHRLIDLYEAQGIDPAADSRSRSPRPGKASRPPSDWRKKAFTAT